MQKAKNYWWIPLAIFLATQLSVGIWWASGLNSKVETQEKIVCDKIKALKETAEIKEKNVELQMTEIKQKLVQIDNKLDRILFRKQGG